MLKPYRGVSVREVRANMRSIESKTCQRGLDGIRVKDHRVSCPQNGAEGAIRFG